MKGTNSTEEGRPQETLGALLESVRESADISQEEFARTTKIPLRHIQALEANDTQKSLPDVYVIGILKQYAHYCDGDEKVLREAFLWTRSQKVSGAGDTLPQNRFATSFRFRFILPKFRWHPAMLLVLIALLYLLFQSRAFFFPPSIQLNSPPQDFVTNQPKLTISGRIEGAQRVSLNGKELTLSRGGSFLVDLALIQGLNSIDIIASNLLGKATRVTRYVILQPSPTPSPGAFVPSPEPTPGAPTTSAAPTR